MTIDQPITGHCLCGLVRYSAQPRILVPRQCWCRVCQYLASGSATTNIIVGAEGLQVEGGMAEYRSVAAAAGT